MNERLKQIAADTDVWCDQHWAGSEFYDVQWEQKYAELIIRECAGLFPLAHTDEQYPRRIDKTIRKHFRGEE